MLWNFLDFKLNSLIKLSLNKIELKIIKFQVNLKTLIWSRSHVEKILELDYKENFFSKYKFQNPLQPPTARTTSASYTASSARSFISCSRRAFFHERILCTKVFVLRAASADALWVIWFEAKINVRVATAQMESESLSFPLQIVVRFWKSSFFYLVGFWQPAHVISFSSFLHRRRDGEDVSWICKILTNLHTKELLHCVLRSGAGGKAWEVHRNSINGQPETRLRKGMEMCERVSSSKFPPNGGKCFVWKKLTNLLFMELGFCRWFINSVTGVSIPPTMNSFFCFHFEIVSWIKSLSRWRFSASPLDNCWMFSHE